MPEIYKQLDDTQQKLEDHYKDMQDVEFTIQEGKLWMLQTRNGKRTGAAMVKIAVDLMEQGVIDEKTALNRIDANKLDELLHPVFDASALKSAEEIAHGLPASPGAATGQVVFFADEAAKYPKSILVRVETSPEDLEGMHLSLIHILLTLSATERCLISMGSPCFLNSQFFSINVDFSFL